MLQISIRGSCQNSRSFSEVKLDFSGFQVSAGNPKARPIRNGQEIGKDLKTAFR